MKFAVPIQIGGVDDHVHLLVTLRQEPALKEILREVKAGSSGWVHETFTEHAKFAWQAGYGAFTVSMSLLPRVKRYIAIQEEHHKKETFQEEFRTFLRKHGIEWDERYVWD